MPTLRLIKTPERLRSARKNDEPKAPNFPLKNQKKTEGRLKGPGYGLVQGKPDQVLGRVRPAKMAPKNRFYLDTLELKCARVFNLLEFKEKKEGKKAHAPRKR